MKLKLLYTENIAVVTIHFHYMKRADMNLNFRSKLPLRHTLNSRQSCESKILTVICQTIFNPAFKNIMHPS